MSDSLAKRATPQGSTLRRAKTATVAGVAAAAMTLGLAAPATLPTASALDITWDPTYTAGTLAALIDVVGNAFPGVGVSIYNAGPPQTITISVGDIPVVGELNLILALENTAADTPNLYNTVASIPQPQNSSIFSNANYRYALLAASGEANLNLIDAYRTEISSVRDGNTPAGYIPFSPSTNNKPNKTEQALVFLQNPLRPNGGLLTRFPGLSGLLGIDTVIPAAGLYTSGDTKTALNTTTIDVTWAYDPFGDFPEIANPFSLINTLNAAVPINLFDGIQVKGDSLIDVGLNVAQVLSLVPLVPVNDGKAWYLTLEPNQLPILTPLRVPSLIVNAALNAVGSPYLLGTPLADALQPAMKILVNTGYSDVVTPEDIATDPATYAGYQSYDRTYKTSATPTPFGSVSPLTPQEWEQVPGDVFQALVSGVQTQLQKPLFGLLVPAQQAGPTAAQRPRAAARVALDTAASSPKPVRARPTVTQPRAAAERAATPTATERQRATR
jgi:hypothetical protein